MTKNVCGSKRQKRRHQQIHVTVLVNCPYVIREPRMRLGGDHNYNYYSREMNKHTVFPR